MLLLLIIHVPNTYVLERSYIIQTLLHDFLGINSEIIIEERKDVLIKENSNSDSRVLRVADILFQTPENQWLTQNSLPKQPLPIWDTNKTCSDVSLVSSKLPIIYGNEVSTNGLNNDYLVDTPDGLYLGLDIFGSAFFMLTRYEELVKPDRDQHDRFPAAASLAYQEGFLDRPIINEYLEILWYCMKRLWPGLDRKKRSFQVILSHDVDQPYLYAFKPVTWLMRVIAGDLLKRRNIFQALNNARIWALVKQGKDEHDPYNTFDFIMNISEENNMVSTFNFLTTKTSKFSCNYSLRDSRIRSLMKEISDRGHMIGYHGAYGSFNNEEQINNEVNELLLICEDFNIQQTIWGGRQHYLQWLPRTWGAYDKANLNYDSSVGFADHIGFRAGICYDFPTYDLKHKKAFKLKELPLVVMEGSVLSENYMGYGLEDSYVEISKLKKRCQMFDGLFTMLWHNSELTSDSYKKIYRNLLK